MYSPSARPQFSTREVDDITSAVYRGNSMGGKRKVGDVCKGGGVSMVVFLLIVGEIIQS